MKWLHYAQARQCETPYPDVISWEKVVDLFIALTLVTENHAHVHVGYQNAERSRPTAHGDGATPFGEVTTCVKMSIQVCRCRLCCYVDIAAGVAAIWRCGGNIPRPGRLHGRGTWRPTGLREESHSIVDVSRLQVRRLVRGRCLESVHRTLPTVADVWPLWTTRPAWGDFTSTPCLKNIFVPLLFLEQLRQTLADIDNCWHATSQRNAT